MRTLKRGVRGEDVLLWQQFLVQLRSKPKVGFMVQPVRLDGIFGPETAGATAVFQRRFALSSDGIVGRDTYLKARGLGFLDRNATQGTPGSEVLGPLLGPYLSQLQSEPPPPGIARADAGRAAPGAGNSRAESHARLRAESWESSSVVRDGLASAGAIFQLLKNGAGDYVYDEYSVLVDAMPAGKTAESFLEEMASDLNGTVRDGAFDTINVFKRRAGGKPRLGQIIDIDIAGPDNGSVVLVALTPTYFVFQTVETRLLETGSHPENGSREFGFERVGTGFRFYTRGVSRPGNYIVRLVGALPQQRGWTRLLMGISARIVQLGGKSNSGTFNMFKENRPQ
jgi:peptidoglycan hydrolase-like protein with peptidoglycan-binding domain